MPRVRGKNWALRLGGSLLVLGLVLGTFYFQERQPPGGGLPTVKETLEVAPSFVMVTPETKITLQEFYTICRHTLPLSLPAKEKLWGKTLAELTVIFPAEKGWLLDVPAPGELVLTREVPGLCPRDSGKHHLGFMGDYVAVYQGLPEAAGGIIQILPVEREKLPRSWRDKIGQGEVVFEGKEDLMEALDSLEEYR